MSFESEIIKKTGLTSERFKSVMREIFEVQEYDLEWKHRQADSLMCYMLSELGYGEGIEVFENAEKWYA